MLCCTKYNKRRKIYGKNQKLLALILSICVICTVSVMSVSAANTDDDNDTSASSTITVHYYCEEGTPTIYYWNSLPKNISTEYPGVKMTSEGNNYYKYTFNDVTKINMMFVTNGKQSAELTRNTGEWWYKIRDGQAKILKICRNLTVLTCVKTQFIL